MAIWQNAGVDTSRARGAPSSSASATVTSWRGHTGSLVQIGSTPWASAVVGVAMAGSAVARLDHA